MNKFEHSNPIENNLRAKSERLHDVLSLIGQAPRVDTAEEAFNLVHTSFSQIENKEKEPRMRVGSFSDMLQIKTDKEAYYTWYLGHILFVGENGSIEIREKPKEFNDVKFRQTPEYINEFRVILSKPGADGLGVW